MAVELPRSLVEYVLLGPMDDRRQLQDSPILGDVWIAFAKEPGKPQDLLITPFESEPAGRVAQSISRRLNRIPDVRVDKSTAPNVAYLQGIAAARLHFVELMRVVLPLTKWWEDKQTQFFRDLKVEDFEKWVKDVLTPSPSASASGSGSTGEQHRVGQTWIDPFHRYVSLTGLLLWATHLDGGPPKAEGKPVSAAGEPSKRRKALNLAKLVSPEKMLREVDFSRVGRLVYELFEQIRTDAAALRDLPETELKPGEREILISPGALIWQISLNRRAMPALEKSLPAVKADAATSLFKVDCKEIAWAVLDSGIHGAHPAFNDADGKTRIKGSYDFRNIRKIVSLDNTDPETLKQNLKELCPLDQPADTDSPEDRDRKEKSLAEKRKALGSLAEDAADRRPIHWDLVEQFICIAYDKEPSSGHGTHVAGITGARKVENTTNAEGMCPNIRLYDFRILTRSAEDTEFAIIAALQYIRHLNSRSSFMLIHGANLSLSIPHDVRNYACGRTPVCVECERLVESGVVVVAAAGNHGWHSYETKEGVYEGYAAFSITDPGNADGVITVGATHRSWPHTYGVSFFSSRGPTGDGRLKPDLVAPGERIRSTLPNNSWGELDGTSMAAPHVSGAAAMLMARYPELVGRPRRVKQILCDSATDLARERSFQGHGMLDVLRAFQSI
jgi:hypothetical protein